MKATRFDLEQQILNCWNVTDDLDVVMENVLENENFSRDDIHNVLLGIRGLYQLKFEKCFETFEELVRTRQLDSRVQWPFESENESF